ncbi:glycosyltransferase [Bernardetia sp. ABR2-2B]|uniref:glycosyltransferase n=1 Tax=Bernardetia sp. ABR2-2B TaxID=3127472 RepID=UPI0030D20704
MKVLHAHPQAGIFIRQTALAYHENNLLESFLTTFISHKEYFLSNLITKIAPYLKTQLERKAIHEIPYSRIKTYPYKELLRLFASRYTSAATTDTVFEWAEYSFDRWVASQIKAIQPNAVHCYEHASLATLQMAKKKGIFTVYEQPSQHHTFFAPIVTEQLKKYPELASNETSLLINDKSIYRNKRRDKELSTTDIILCNSSFTKRTLVDANIDKKKIHVIPHGFPKSLSIIKEKNINDRPVVFLNAGTQNLRKGIHLLYNAWKKANFSEKEAELWLIGKNTLPEKLLQGIGQNVRIKDSIPREELMQLYKEADIFILPTLADGFAMVLSEAMSQGVPVITTPNSMAPDFIIHNKNGWIVPVGKEEELLNQMKWCVENKHLIPKISHEALETAKKWQWKDYRKKTAETVQNQYLLHEEAKNRK